MTSTHPVPPTADLLDQVESLLGYTPRRSIVLMGLFRGRASDSLRVDLPAEPSAEVMSEILTLACRLTRVDSLALLVYADDLLDGSYAADAGLPAADAAGRLASGLEEMGFLIARSVVSTPSFWAEYGSGRPVRQRHRGRTSRTSGSSEAGGHPTRSIREAAELPRADASLSQAVAEAVDSFLDRFPHAELPDHLATAAFDFARSTATGGSTAIDAGAVAGLIVLAQDPDRWPRLVAETAWNGDLLALAAGEPPVTEAAEHIIGLWRLLASVCPRTELVSVLTMLAWLHWMLGQSSFAAVHAQDALAMEPRHPFLLDLLSSLDAGALPEWISQVGSPHRLRGGSTPLSGRHGGSARSR